MFIYMRSWTSHECLIYYQVRSCILWGSPQSSGLSTLSTFNVFFFFFRIPTKYSIIGKDDENAKKLKLLSRENKGIKTQKYLKLQDEHIQKSMVSSAPLLQRLYDSGGVKLEEDWANMLYTPLPPSLVCLCFMWRKAGVNL